MTMIVVILFIALVIFFIAFNAIDWRRREEKMLNELQHLRKKKCRVEQEN